MFIYIEPMSHAPYVEHAEDVLAQWLEWRNATGAALAMIIATEGGGVRAPGALMAISAEGRVAGYLSGGCIDADVAAHAVSAMETNKPVHLRYGAGSPFVDLPLPCGGAIDVAIFPNPDPTRIRRCHANLASRRRASLSLEGPRGVVSAEYRPKLRVRIAGRGADAIALARVCKAAGLSTELWLRDGDDLEHARAAGLNDAVALRSPSAMPEMADDPWTAFALMFHDRDWETPLLHQALSGPAFYIGAVGGKGAQVQRRQALAEIGLEAPQIGRVRGPVGLIPSMRDASMLAVSTLAEIVEAYHTADDAPFATTALVMLAAGQSSRFEDGDKLLADLNGAEVLAHSCRALAHDVVGRRFAVIGPGHARRRDLLEQSGWRSVDNPDADQGQATSLAAGVSALSDAPGVDAALVLLADMPFVPDTHLHALRAAMTPGVQAVMSRTNGVLGPPALFSREVFPKLQALTGDRGARGVFDALLETRSVDLAPEHARDIDRRADLAAVEALADG